MPKVKKSTADRSIRISLAGDLLWEALASRLGLSKTSVLEMLVRDAAASRGIETTGEMDWYPMAGIDGQLRFGIKIDGKVVQPRACVNELVDGQGFGWLVTALDKPAEVIAKGIEPTQALAIQAARAAYDEAPE